MVNDETLAKAFKALAHPRRARIFRLLAEHPEVGRSFTNIQRVTGIGETPLVHHLREMERCGLLARRRRGTFMAHTLVPGPLLRALAEASHLGKMATGPARRRAA